MQIRVSYNPYSGVDWGAEEGYYQFHAHCRKLDAGEVERLYEATGHRGLVVGDAPCRDDHDQVGEYWPWPTTGADLDAHHDGGMVPIPGGERDGGGLAHTLAINSLYRPACGRETQRELIAGITDSPVVGDTAVAVLNHPTSARCLETYAAWIRSHDFLVGQEGWHMAADHSWDVYHDILDHVTRRWWHIGGDDFSYNRESFDRSRDVNRCYFLLETHSVENVIRRLVDGGFYSTHAPGSNGHAGNAHPPTIDAITVERRDGEITVDPSGTASVEWISTGGSVVATGPTLAYRAHADILDGSWAYARLRSASAEARTQPFSFDTRDADRSR